MKTRITPALKRIIIILLCLFPALFSLESSVAAQDTRIFTLQELAGYNGQNGNRAYVAVNGLIYDLTDVPEWANGRHYCAGAIAGKDITFLWKLVPPSHRDPDFLKRFPVVGRLAAAKPQPSASPVPSPARAPSLAGTLILGFLFAVLVSAAWILIRLKRR